MRVKVEYTVWVSDEARAGLARAYGEPGLASRAAVKEWLEQNGVSGLDDLEYEEDSTQKLE